MPKRLSKTTRASQKDFLRGYSFGMCACIFGLKLQELRKNKGVTHEDIAQATGLAVELIKDLEQAKVGAFMGTSTQALTALANYFDVAIQVVFKPAVQMPDSLIVKTFEQELTSALTPFTPPQP